ncbi:MAG: Cna B-type domain-containing protein, partial [Clostridia bacterium]|nr:Cna B-type domain-containing protein [Clostridia bacterium]
DIDELSDITRPAVVTYRLWVQTDNGRIPMAGADGMQLSASGTPGHWNAVFSDVPVSDKEGNDIIYLVTEDKVEGYEEPQVSIDENGNFHIINALTTTDVSVSKVWEDDDNREGSRPDEIFVQLTANGENMGDPVRLTGSDWAYTWTGLPLYQNNGSEFIYAVDETEVPLGYVKTVTEENDHQFLIKNTYVFPALVNISAKKILDGPLSLEDGQFSFELVDIDGNVLDTKTNDIFGNIVFNAMKFDAVGTHSYYVREVIEEEAAGYVYDSRIYEAVVDIRQNADDHQFEVSVQYKLEDKNVNEIRFENVYQPAAAEFSIPVRKEVEADESAFVPDITNAFTFQLSAVTPDAPMPDDDSCYNPDADGGDALFGPIQFEKAGEYEYSIIETGSVPSMANDEESKTVKITVKDDGTGQLKVTWSSHDADHPVVFKNTYVTTDLSGIKKWDDKDNMEGFRPDEITVNLLANGMEVRNVTVTEKDEWKWTFAGLPVFDKNGKIDYSMQETAVANYQTNYDTDAETGIVTITNYREPEYTFATVVKEWDDNDDQDGKRPDKLVVTLSDGTKAELNESNSWRVTLENLPKYQNGTLVDYTWTEGELPEGYTQTGTETTNNVTIITNSHTPELTTATVKKTWDDKDNQDGKR